MAITQLHPGVLSGRRYGSFDKGAVAPVPEEGGGGGAGHGRTRRAEGKSSWPFGGFRETWAERQKRKKKKVKLEDEALAVFGELVEAELLDN